MQSEMKTMSYYVLINSSNITITCSNFCWSVWTFCSTYSFDPRLNYLRAPCTNSCGNTYILETYVFLFSTQKCMVKTFILCNADFFISLDDVAYNQQRTLLIWMTRMIFLQRFRFAALDGTRGSRLVLAQR